MPNWPLGVAMRNHLQKRLLEVAAKPVRLSRMNFPLSVHDIQYGGLNLSDEQLGTLKKLWSEGVRTIARTTELRLAFLQEKFPELRRGVVLKLELPDYVFTGRATMYGMSAPRFDPHDAHYIVPEFLNLTQDERAKLIAWLDRAIRQERMYEIVAHCVMNIVNNSTRTPTIAHLTAIWPGAGSVIDPKTSRHRHEQEMIAEWKERFRNPPLRNKQLYTPDPEFMRTWAKLIRIADVQIAQGLLLDELHMREQDDKIAVQVEHWQRIEGDITF